MPNKYRILSLKKIFAFCTAVCAASFMNACQGPEDVARKDFYDATDGDEYRLDVFMLAEWAGHIIPRKDSIRFFLYFDLEQDEEGKETKVNAIYLDKEKKCSVEKNNNCVDVTAIFEKNQDGVFFYPYGKTAEESDEVLSQIRYECLYLGGENAPNGEYMCNTYQSGANEINDVWNFIANHSRTPAANSKLVIGSGDNYGVSQIFSSTYGDYPTIQMQNALGMSVETFGNHSFDNTLPVIQNLIDVSNFPYVISNFINLPNNLERTTPYAIFKVPPVNDENGKKLSVAVVGAFENSSQTIISRGHFETITIDNYCPVIQALEEAYNKNARAFIILSHVFTDQYSIFEFFNGIFSLDEEFLKNIKDFKNKHKDENLSLDFTGNYPCSSHLIVTEDMLDPNSDKSLAEQAAELRLKLHQEIYDNILLVFGEATHTPFMLGMIPGSSDTPMCSSDKTKIVDNYYPYNVNGCIPDGTDANKDVFQSFSNHSRFANDTSSLNAVGTKFEKGLRALGYTSFEYDKEFDDEQVKADPMTNRGLGDDSQKHPIWFMDLDRVARMGTRAVFKITKRTDNPNELFHKADNIAAAYRSEMINYRIVPVFGKPFGKQDLPVEKCEENFAGEWKDIVPQTCKQYYSDYKAYSADTKNNEKPDYMPCVKDMMNIEATIRRLQEIWICLYNITDKSICSFGDYTIGSENKDKEIRKYSTFITNFVTDTLLRYYSSVFQGKRQVDAVLFGAGTTRETLEFNEIDNDFFNASLPFPNSLELIPFDPAGLANVIDASLNTGISGSFPTLAGIKYSYSIREEKVEGEKELKKVRHVRELWKYNLNTKQHELLFLNNVSVNDCILGALEGPDGSKCKFGEYVVIDGNSVQVKLTDFTLEGKAFTDKTDIAIDPNKQIYTILTNYTAAGGDKFPDQSNKMSEQTAISKSLNDDFMKALSKDDENRCQIEFSGQTMSYKEILDHNIIKRIFYIASSEFKDDTGIIGDVDVAKDYPNNICIATQDVLASVLLNNNNTLGENVCDYGGYHPNVTE